MRPAPLAGAPHEEATLPLVMHAGYRHTNLGRWVDAHRRHLVEAVLGLIVVLLYMPIFELAGSLQ